MTKNNDDCRLNMRISQELYQAIEKEAKNKSQSKNQILKETLEHRFLTCHETVYQERFIQIYKMLVRISALLTHEFMTKREGREEFEQIIHEIVNPAMDSLQINTKLCPIDTSCED